ncbi:unnamed protein product [Calicophoron daubneyi]|uniref:Signal recognition particle subunit SRP72 n=1 Tax=Calicophoron daubneyi TaxID=300641 RepID=A0AAV2TBK1_CALDB
MATAKVFDVSAAYSELNKACIAQSYNRVVTLATKILSHQPLEYPALQCKAVALIRTEKYEDCLALIKKFPELLKYVVFEKAYSEYRLNRINEAAKTLENADPEDLRILELKAQVCYRKEEFEEAYTCLRKVIRNSQDDFEEERLTNLAAVAASASCFKGTNIDIDVAPEMYEAKFNLACLQIGRGNYHSAEKLLKEAEELCRITLADDAEVTQDEIDQELAPIRAQQAYLLQQSKKEEAANQIYQAVTRHRSIDSALLAVIANNIVCINKEQNIFDSRKRIKMTSTDGLQHKLLAKQRRDILMNQALFYFHTNQADACHSKLRSVLQEDPRSSRGNLLLAAQMIKEKQYERAVSLLRKYCDAERNGPDNPMESDANLEVKLALAQLLLRSVINGQLSGGIPHPQKALDVVRFLEESLAESELNAPGLICTRIALYLLGCAGEGAPLKREDALGAINNLVQSALTWYESTNEESADYVHLLDRCANVLLQNGQAELAARLCERQLAKLDMKFNSNDDQKASARQGLIARLVRAYAQFDRPKAEAACKSLKFRETVTEADVDSLETAFLYGAKAVKRHGRPGDQPSAEVKVKATPGSTPGPSSAGNDTQVIKKRKHRKKRAIRLPKNCQPGVMPDPERWLPRRERTYYRGKRRDKRHVTSRGPQGQVTGSAELDAVIQSPKVNSNPSPRPDPTAGASAVTAGSTPKQTSGAARQQQRKGRRKGR